MLDPVSPNLWSLSKPLLPVTCTYPFSPYLPCASSGAETAGEIIYLETSLRPCLAEPVVCVWHLVGDRTGDVNLCPSIHTWMKLHPLALPLDIGFINAITRHLATTSQQLQKKTTQLIHIAGDFSCSILRSTCLTATVLACLLPRHPHCSATKIDWELRLLMAALTGFLTE